MQDDGADDIDTGASEAPAEVTTDRAAATSAAKAEARRANARMEGLDEPDDFEAAAPAGHVVQRKSKHRVLGSEARQKLAEMVTDLKKQVVESGANVDEMDDYDTGEPEPAKRLAGEQPEPKSKQIAAATTRPAADAAPTPAPEAAPAPSLDPSVLDKRRQLDAYKRELDERARELEQRASDNGVQALYDQFSEAPTQTVVDFIKKSLGVEKDDDIKTELADLISQLSGDVLGVPLPPEVKAALESKRTVRIVKNHERRLTEREKQIEAKQAAAAEAAAKQQVQRTLDTHVRHPDNAKQWPWLSRESNVGEIITDVIDAQYEADLKAMRARGEQGTPTAMAWTEAAKRADAYLKKQASDYYSSRKDLFESDRPPAPAPPPAAPVAAKPSAQQGDPAGIRGSRTLSNVAASQPTGSQPPASPPSDEDGAPQRSRHWSNDKWRRQTRGRLREAFRASESQDE